VSTAQPPSFEETLAGIGPYRGPSLRQVDPATPEGKLLCGYQGWFNTPDDGAGRGWYHYQGRQGFAPGSCTIDLWPDLREFPEEERDETAFRHADGRPAEVFSSYRRGTVLRHFEWMQTYGIDGVFAQRFAMEALNPSGFHHFTTVLGHCREGANRHGRVYALMYDLSGMPGDTVDRLKDDWRRLVTGLRLTRDPGDRAYLHYRGRPLVAVWGVGFNDNRKYSLRDCREFVRFLQEDPDFGGCAVMLGVPTFWRSQTRDALDDPYLHEVLAAADIVSPWTIGRFRTPDEATAYYRDVVAADMAWCRERGVGYMPVAFPGFSWHNMFPEQPLDVIPRLGGRFLWSQYVAARRAGAGMIYQAMFDEIDEGTAIFKCSGDPPVGESRFLTYGDLPSDHYLWLAGMGARLFRGGLSVEDDLPVRADPAPPSLTEPQ
jgi:hypothetical protein